MISYNLKKTEKHIECELYGSFRVKMVARTNAWLSGDPFYAYVV